MGGGGESPQKYSYRYKKNEKDRGKDRKKMRHHGPVLRSRTKAVWTTSIHHSASRSTDHMEDDTFDTSGQSISAPIIGTATAATAAAAAATTTASRQECRPVPVPDEPALFYFPSGVYPEYQRLPGAVQLGVWLASIWVAAFSSFNKIQWAWIRSLMALRIGIGAVQWGKIINFLAKATVLALICTVVLQDAFYSPSRISAQKLANDFFLPSKYSRYDAVALDDDDEDDGSGTTTTLGVHHLVYEASNPNRNNNNNTGVIYLNHGFGASSLSWLPAMRPLVEKLGYRCVVSHDAPGFGFTDRPRNYLEAYTTRGSASIGSNLLRRFWQKDNNNNNNNSSEKLLLMGHSMGSVTTLRMALQLPPNVKKQIVLVSPALGFRPNQRKPAPNKNRKVPVTYFLQRLVDPLAAYVLRRAVGRRGFWKASLQVAWGDSTRVSDTDVLRFQWPSIGQGWDQGLVTFARAQFQSMELTDDQLLRQVLSLPNTTVHVIYGERDRIVKPETIRSLFEPYRSNVKLIELKRLGHDPFEEDVDSFLSALIPLLQSDPSVDD